MTLRLTLNRSTLQDKGVNDDDLRIAWLRYCRALHYGRDPGACQNRFGPDGPALARPDHLSAELFVARLRLRLRIWTLLSARLQLVKQLIQSRRLVLSRPNRWLGAL